MSDTPFYPNDEIHGRCLELGGDGSYESCQRLLSELQETFSATYSEHVESGPRPDWKEGEKEHGYWNVKMFGQDFFVMRVRGDGMCIWGPKPPVEIQGFLRVAHHFGASERVQPVSFITRVARWLRLTKQKRLIAACLKS
ncbi:MAG: hypothetical protein WCJ09_03595 [Planctomycetota bacterium]